MAEQEDVVTPRSSKSAKSLQLAPAFTEPTSHDANRPHEKQRQGHTSDDGDISGSIAASPGKRDSWQQDDLHDPLSFETASWMEMDFLGEHELEFCDVPEDQRQGLNDSSSGPTEMTQAPNMTWRALAHECLEVLGSLEARSHK